MQSIRDVLQQNWLDILLPLTILVITVTVGLIVRRVVFKALKHWASKTETNTDEILIDAVSGPFIIWVLTLGLYLAVETSTLTPRFATVAGKVLLVLLIISLTIVAAQLAGNFAKLYGSRVSGALPVTSLTQNLARLFIGIIGILVVLSLLGVSITPMLTALGVGGLAVALALQDTLSNLFAGFYVGVSGNIRLGDYIKLDTGEEGYVTDINWRSTTVLALRNNLIIVPNSKLAQAIVTNFHLPEKRMSLPVAVSVSYESDPEEVERILIEEATKGAEDIPGLLDDPPPVVRFNPGFGDSSLDFTLVCQVSEFVDQFLVQHELRKRIFNRFRQGGIEIPFPIRTVYLRDHTTGALRETVQRG